MRHIYDTFHISLFDAIKSTAILLHRLSAAPPAAYVKDNHKYFEVEDILDSHRT